MPLYHAVRTGRHELTPTDVSFSVPLGHRTVTGPARAERRCPTPTCRSTSSSSRTCSSATIRTRAAGCTSTPTPDGRKHDYADNADRFIVFCRAIMEVLPRLDAPLRHSALQRLADRPDPVLLARTVRPAEPRQRPSLRRPAHADDIHNIAYQGAFPASVMAAHRDCISGSSTTGSSSSTANSTSSRPDACSPIASAPSARDTPRKFRRWCSAAAWKACSPNGGTRSAASSTASITPCGIRPRDRHLAATYDVDTSSTASRLTSWRCKPSMVCRAARRAALRHGRPAGRAEGRIADRAVGPRVACRTTSRS